jgi:ubiquinol-cytochrome c reductase cytochrome b subunit
MIFTIFGASATDILANFFRVSLNATLWFFRVSVFVIPVIVYFVVFQMCREFNGTRNIGKRKRAVVVTRSAEGEYATTPTAPRPGDGHEELEPVPVPIKVELLPDPVGVTVGSTPDGEGVRRVNR